MQVCQCYSKRYKIQYNKQSFTNCSFLHTIRCIIYSESAFGIKILKYSMLFIYQKVEFHPPPHLPLDNVEWWLIKHQLVFSVMQTGRQSDRQTDKQTAKSKFIDLPSISLNIVKGVGGGHFFFKIKNQLQFIFIKIIKFQTITHLIVCKMGEKKIY